MNQPITYNTSNSAAITAVLAGQPNKVITLDLLIICSESKDFEAVVKLKFGTTESVLFTSSALTGQSIIYREPIKLGQSSSLIVECTAGISITAIGTIE